MSEANKTQVGGSHYKRGGEEHWDRQWRLFGRGYFVGCITKYVERYPDKGGVEDLKKARHFIDKLIELETAAAANKAAGEPSISWYVREYANGNSNWRCLKCGTVIEESEMTHGDCPGSSYVNQD